MIVLKNWLAACWRMNFHRLNYPELTDLVRRNPTQLAELQDQLEAAEMLVLSEDELHTPERFLVGLRSADEAIPAGFSPVAEVTEPKSDRFWWAAPMALAAILVLAFALWPSAMPGTSIATIQSVHGEVQWTGDGGKLQNARSGPTNTWGNCRNAFSRCMGCRAIRRRFGNHCPGAIRIDGD